MSTEDLSPSGDGHTLSDLAIGTMLASVPPRVTWCFPAPCSWSSLVAQLRWVGDLTEKYSNFYPFKEITDDFVQFADNSILLPKARGGDVVDNSILLPKARGGDVVDLRLVDHDTVTTTDVDWSLWIDPRSGHPSLVPPFNSDVNRVSPGVFEAPGKVEDFTVYGSPVIPAPFHQANVFTSRPVESHGASHRLLLDVDMEGFVWESTSGNLHLDLGPVKWKHYVKVLDALVEAGVVQQGFADNTKRHGYATLRMPHVNKLLEHADSDGNSLQSAQPVEPGERSMLTRWAEGETLTSDAVVSMPASMTVAELDALVARRAWSFTEDVPSSSGGS